MRKTALKGLLSQRFGAQNLPSKEFVGLELILSRFRTYCNVESTPFSTL